MTWFYYKKSEEGTATQHKRETVYVYRHRKCKENKKQLTRS